MDSCLASMVRVVVVAVEGGGVGGVIQLLSLREDRHHITSLLLLLLSNLLIDPFQFNSNKKGIEDDATEFASQFMENWIYDKTTFDTVAKHWETGEHMPEVGNGGGGGGGGGGMVGYLAV